MRRAAPWLHDRGDTHLPPRAPSLALHPFRSLFQTLPKASTITASVRHARQPRPATTACQAGRREHAKGLYLIADAAILPVALTSSRAVDCRHQGDQHEQQETFDVERTTHIHGAKRGRLHSNADSCREAA